MKKLRIYLAVAAAAAAVGTWALPTPASAEGLVVCQATLNITSASVALVPSQSMVRWDFSGPLSCVDAGGGTLSGHFLTDPSGCSASGAVLLWGFGRVDTDAFGLSSYMSTTGEMAGGVLSLTMYSLSSGVEAGSGQFAQDPFQTAACVTNGSSPTSTTWTGAFEFATF